MKYITILIAATCILLSCKSEISGENKSSGKPQEHAKETSIKGRNLKLDGSKYTVEELERMSHNSLMALTYETPRDTILTIGILLYNGYFSLDAMGPHSVLSSMYPAKTFFIAKKKGLIKSNNGVKTQVDTTISEVDQLDILVVPGGTADTYRATKDQELLDWIKEIDQNSKYTTSVCSGAWILGASGLLKGRKATTNWYDAESKLSSYGATFVDKRYTNDGKYWTSAGVSAGIDMSLALVDHIMGRNYADFVMLNLEYDPTPPFEGGSPGKTDPVIEFMTKKMYDLSINPVIEELKE